MNINNRLKKMESQIVKEDSESCDDKMEICEHPPSMFTLRQEYPATGYCDRRMVICGHCNLCGFDDYLWSYYALTEEQEFHRQQLKYASDFWGLNSYYLELLNAGLISYAVYPPSPEVQMKFTGKVTI